MTVFRVRWPYYLFVYPEIAHVDHVLLSCRLGVQLPDSNLMRRRESAFLDVFGEEQNSESYALTFKS